MNKRLKNILWGFFLAIFISACQSQLPVSKITASPSPHSTTATPDDRTPTPTKVPVIKVDTQQLAGIQITLLHPWAGETARMLNLMVDEFNQTNEWGIHVMINEAGSTGLAIQGLENVDPSESLIDLVAVPAYQLFYQDQTQQKVVDLNPYVHSKEFGLGDSQLEDFYPAFWNENLMDGKLYGIPAQQTAEVLFYNSTWAKELGFSKIPITTENFRLQSCAANATFRKDYDRSNDGLGGWIISSDSGSLYSWLNSFAALDLTRPADSFSSAGTQKTFEYLFNLQKDSCAWSSRMPQPYDYFANRQALAYSGTLQDIRPQTDAFLRFENDDEWKVLLYPAKEDQKMLTEGLSWGVIQTEENRQLAAWLFIRWISQPVNQTRLLQTTGSLPLGSQTLEEVRPLMDGYPQWEAVISMLPLAVPVPAQADSGIVKTVLQDAGSYLFKPEFTADKIPELLTQLDMTIRELAERQP